MRRLALLLISLASFAQTYTPAPGPLHVLTVDYMTLHDAKRKKDLPLKIYYPQGAGPFPVIVWSHGLYGSRETYRRLGEYWASHGYVVIHPSHEDSLQHGTIREGLRDALTDPRLIESRPQDISLVISSLAEIERMQPSLKGKLDAARIGAGGHSYGAYTAEAIAGALVSVPHPEGQLGGPKGGVLRVPHPEARPKGGVPTSFADKRVAAVVVMSPQGEGEMGLTRQSWSGIHLPVLTMYGSLDFGSQRRTPDWRSQPFTYSAPGDKYDVEFQGATHMTFTGPRRPGAAEDKLFQCAKIEALAFWDAFLKSDPAARRYLDSDALNTFCSGAARIARK